MSKFLLSLLFIAAVCKGQNIYTYAGIYDANGCNKIAFSTVYVLDCT